MKKVFVPALVLIAIALVISAPVSAQTSMVFGPKAGLSLAKLTGSDAGDVDYKTGLVVGAFLGIGVSPSLTVQPELNYVMKGAKQDTAGYSAKAKLNYMEVPLLLKWTPPTQGSMQPTLFVGPVPAFLMSAKVSADSAGLSGEIDVKDETKSFDFGLAFGGGLDFAAGSGTVCFDVRYTLGLSSIDDTGSDADVKNGNFSATIGYAIPIGKK